MKDKTLQTLISNLIVSVRDFHERFGLDFTYTREDLLARIPIQEEEVRELYQAIIGESSENIANEAIDVLYVAIGTLLCLDPELVEESLSEVINKNNSKTTKTHYINDMGKVVRRPK